MSSVYNSKNMVKTTLLILGILWSGGLLTAQVFKVLDLGTNRDFFLGVFGASATALGLKPTDKKPSSDTLEDPDYDP